MSQELRPIPAHQVPNGSLSVPSGDSDDLTPVHTPTSSPLPTRRSRIVSVSNPEPMIRIMVQGIIQKVEAFLEYLDDRLLLSVVEECDKVVKTTIQGGWS